jgi:hypothetical protein
MSRREEIEEKIKEQRTIEANKKGLIGQNGKIGTVLRVLGQPIISQFEGGSYLDSNYIDLRGDSFLEEEPKNNNDLLKKIPIMDAESNERPTTSEWAELEEPNPVTVQSIGWHFDGLSRGMHLEIKYENSSSELLVTYQGYTVYKEISGEVTCYVPNEEWENWIERLSKGAKEIQRKLKEKEFEENIKQTEKQKQNWWSAIQEKWGIL